MLLGHINHPETYDPFLQHPTWEKVLQWLKNEAVTLPDREYEIDGRNIYAPISTINTLPQAEAKYEAHQQYIDVHYCLEGGEIIEWAPVATLKPIMDFDIEKDYCLYESPAEATTLLMTPGTFAIFFPADAHMPKISDNKNHHIRKVVVKINLNSLNPAGAQK
jgi:YhcH/YjgK/YiaL family protein